MVNNRQHAARKRILANLYSKTAIQSSPEIRKISRALLIERFLPIIDAAARDQDPVDILELGSAFAMDFISAYLFGLSNSSNLLQDLKTRTQWLAVYHSTKPYSFWPQEFPALTSFLSRFHVRVLPRWVDIASDEVKDLCLKMFKDVDSFSKESGSLSRAEEFGSTEPVVYNQLSRFLGSSTEALSSESSSQPSLSIASELMDHLAAGHETTGVTLTYLMHELSQRPILQSSLRSELLSLSPPLTYHSLSTTTTDSSELPHPRALDALSLLDAILMETLRLYPAAPGPQPRITPVTPTTLAGYPNVPGGVRVSAQAYSLHRNPEVFPKPETWNPERWLRASDRSKHEMMRWFWAFGSGARMCIGSHFAMHGK